MALRHRPEFHALVTILTSLFVLVTACGKDESPTPTGPQPGPAQEKVEEANQALSQILFDELNSHDIEAPDDFDISVPNSLYQQALALDPANLDAHFGVALTDLVTLTVDDEVNAAFTEWKDYLENHTPFTTPVAGGKLLGVSLLPSRDSDMLQLPFELVPLSALAPLTLARDGEVPQVSRVQNILEQRFLPRLVSASAHLATVSADASYRFVVSGHMQGDDHAEAVEIDQTDILALRAGCSLLAAATRIAVSYDLDLAAYDSLSLHQALQPGSPWLSLRPGGRARMQQARTDLLAAVDQTDAAINSLLNNEADDQDDDVIRIGSGADARADVDSVRNRLPDIRDALESGYAMAEDWDDDSHTPDQALLINLGALLADPVQDWKALLPSYRGEVTSTATGWDWHWSDNNSYAVTVDVPQSGYCSFYAWLSFNEGDDSPTFLVNSSSNDWLGEALRPLMTQRFEATRAANPHLVEYYSSTYLYQNLSAGPQTLTLNGYSSWGVATERMYIPVIVWTASDFEHWTLPDPTIHGVLPQMSSSGEFFETFGIRAEHWEPRMEIDWSDIDFDIDFDKTSPTARPALHR